MHGNYKDISVNYVTCMDVVAKGTLTLAESEYPGGALFPSTVQCICTVGMCSGRQLCIIVNS
jgi:hypothetical protein